MTMNEVKLQLAQEESSKLNSGIPSLHEVSPATFLEIGLQLERAQLVTITQSLAFVGLFYITDAI